MPHAHHHIPNHAYSFSCSIFLATAAALNAYLGTAPQYTVGSLTGSLLFALHGLYDLKKEHRLHRVFKPVTDRFHHFFQTQTENIAENNEQANTVSRIQKC